MDASRAPISAPGMVMSRYHRIPGPCILPVRSLERALRREGKVPWRGTSLRLLRHFFSFSRVSLFVSQSRSYLSLPPSSESSRTRNSRSTVRTLNAQPCSHFRRAHTRADNAACRRLATSLLLLLIISTVVFLLSDHSHDKYFRKSRFSNGTNTHISY